MSSEILKILKGIDQTQTESEEGWWETSEGARFGAEKLEAVISRFKKLESQRDELLEALKYLMYWFNNGLTPPSQSIKTAREILAKAKGEA